MDPHVLPTNTPQGKPEGDVKDPQSFSKGSKRLFSHTFSGYSQEEDSASNYGSGSDGRHLDEDDPFEKRHRTSDWPLGKNGKAVEGAAADGPDSPASNYSDDGVQPRSSKFIEGSMRNRASQRPPRKYVVTETELNCAGENECTKSGKPQRNKLVRNSTQSVPAVAGETKTEANRHSAVFRFGKSLAASFNPSNWKIWSKSQDAQVPDDKADVDAEAQAKLERAYREVKNIAPTPGRRFGPAGGSAIWSNARSSMNASGVDISEQAPPSQKRYGMVFDTPPSLAGLGSIGDYSAQQSTSKLSTPADLYSVPCHQLLHSNESRSSFTYGSIAPPKSVKHKISRKDLRVQQKLVKRVSNLESKLEAARLELVKSLGTTGLPPPQTGGGKSRFVPGALSSLPSESLLNGYTHQNESTQGYIGAALTTDDKISLSSSRNHGETPGRPSMSSFSSSVRDYPNRESHAAAAGQDDTDQATPSKKRKDMTKTNSTTSTSPHPSDADTTTSSHPTPNPAKKARSTSAKEKPSPELLLPDSGSSDRSFENVDPEKKAVLVSVGAKQQGTPKLIVKKRVLPLETQGSRIPRKGSRKDTPTESEVGDDKGISVTSGNVGLQTGGNEAAVVETQPRQVTGKLKKAAKPRVKSTEISTSEKQVEEKTKDTKENLPAARGGKITNSTSMDSFEWGPDVF
ncbi:hypothetical protein VE02_09892 [Pseudogymnoascus sp. 03VT05]|nr:hypothetical protein VE02_09892 [Pseudogymnoascus sp. 03VT05]